MGLSGFANPIVSAVMNQLTASTLMCLVTLIPATAYSADPADTHPDLPLIPWPKSVELRSGFLSLSETGRIVAEDDRLLPLAKVLAAELKLLTDLDLLVATTEPRPGDIVLRIDSRLRAKEPILSVRDRELVRTTDGAHTVEIDAQAVVTGFDYRATGEGTSTLLQLLGRSDGK